MRRRRARGSAWPPGRPEKRTRAAPDDPILLAERHLRARCASAPPQRPAASAPRRAPTTPSRRGGTNAGKGSRQTRSSAQRPRGSRSYNTPAVWTKEAPRSNPAGGAARRALGAVGGVLLSLLALVGKGLATLLRALAALVARSRIALAVVVVCAALLASALRTSP